MKEVVALIQDDESLRAERKKAKKNKDKYIGMSGGRSGQFYSESFNIQLSGRFLNPLTLVYVATLLMRLILVVV